ncbi:MAG: efflux RND transporter periplasmic adaptor subunit [Bradyrhizobiaceae bacterium]|nr:MAG: efflux RND transporter periplasmic adaptor subunit [Bradyrhizobiaceae bacterium]
MDTSRLRSLNRFPRWTYILLAVIVAGGGYWLFAGSGHKTVAAKPQPVPVTVATVEKADFPVYQLGLGSVQGFNTVQVRSRVDGQIDKIAFTEGQIVSQGDLLVQIDPRPFQATLDAALAKKTQDEAAIANAQLDLQRSTKLGEFATRQTVDTQRSNVQQLTAQIASDEAAIFNARTQLDYASIRAPIAGVTGIRMVDVGNIISAAAQTPIVSIAQIEPIAVIFTVPEQQLPIVSAAMKQGELKVIAYTSDGRTKLSEGVLALVNNQVDTTSGTIRLKAVFENKDHKLWPGMSVTTRLLVNTVKDAAVAPDDAVQRGQDGLYTFVVGEGNKAQVRKIKVAYSTDGRSMIESGLTPGDRVITGGQLRVQNGSPLAIKGANSVASNTAQPAQSSNPVPVKAD